MIFYAISVAVILAGCFAFYKIFLQSETFFPLNRFVLLGCLALSFGLPLIPVPQQFSFRKVDFVLPLTTDPAPADKKMETPNKESAVNFRKEKIKEKTPVATKANTTEEKSFFKNVSVLEIILWVYWVGVAVFSLNFLFQLIILLYRVYSRPFIQDGKFRIVEVSGDQAPCSFANNILINPEKYDWDTYSQIILHEKIHIQQGHSYDIIFAELALVFQWFNPFAWLYRKAMEDNLEFLTDSELLQHSDIEPESYQMSLVKVSAPNFPASLTTNYNQSILKRRLIMMNAKKSNINSTWKYLCIVPLLLVFICLLNEPIAYGKDKVAPAPTSKNAKISNKGNWFATIKGDKVKIRFEDETEGGNNYNNTEFNISDFSNLPKGQKGDFSLSRAAGKMNFNGKFDGTSGMGTYEFKADQSFFNFLQSEDIVVSPENDALVFFFIDLKKDYVKDLKALNYTKITKDELIPLTALKVSIPYIKSLMSAGITDLTLQDLIPLKALDVDAAYIADVKKAGYKNLTADKLVTLKAQGIDGEMIKAAKVTEDSRASAPTKIEVPINTNINTKTSRNTNSDDDFDRTFGLMIAKKALNISLDYAKSFSGTNLKVDDEMLIAFKALGVTADYVKGFEEMGIEVEEEEITSMKALDITPAEYKAYAQLGFKKLKVEEIISAKSTGTTPAFISAMKKKGHNYNTVEKYVAMKVTSAGD